MKKILDYLKLSVFVVAVLIGVQVPGLVDQYGKNLDARVSESGHSVTEFQDDADQFFNGDINRLITHYEDTLDPVIVSGGESIEALVSRNQFLISAQQEFRESLKNAYLHVFMNPISEIRNDVWSNYTYTVILNAEAISVGIITGLCTLGLFELFVTLMLSFIGMLNKSNSGTRKKSTG